MQFRYFVCKFQNKIINIFENLFKVIWTEIVYFDS